MTNTWILVANASDARFFKMNGRAKEFFPIKSFGHPEGRLKNHEITTDRPGRAYASVGSRRSAMNPETTPHKHEEMMFAKLLINFLEKNFKEHQFEKLTLVAPAQFLGSLKKGMSSNLKKSIQTQITKDFPASWVEDRKLFEHLQEELAW